MLESNSLINIVKTGDKITFSGMNSYDSDGSIISYSWSISNSDGVTQFNSAEEQFEYVFEIATSYTVTLTVTDNYGDSTGWQGSIIVEENIVSGSEENEENDITLIIGGAIATIGIAAVVGLRYFRSEEEDDFFEFEDTGPVNLSCPNCSGLITITTDQRPIQVGCPMCQAQFVIRE